MDSSYYSSLADGLFKGFVTVIIIWILSGLGSCGSCVYYWNKAGNLEEALVKCQLAAQLSRDGN